VLFGRGAERRDGPGPPSSLPLWTETEVLVSGQDLTGVVLRFLPGAVVTGRVTVQGSPLPEGLAKALIGLRSLPAIAGAEVSPAFVPVATDGTFAIPNVPPGKYRLMLTGIASWTLRSAVHAGRDSLDVPLEVRPGENITDLLVTLTDRPAAISGTLFDQLGRPAPEFAVVVFSANREHWTTAPRRMSGLVKIGSDGQFKVSGLPPGDYLLVAVTDAEPTQLQDPAFLDELVPGAIRVTLGEGEQRVQDLKLGG
jgi:hypothetical protein